MTTTYSIDSPTIHPHHLHSGAYPSLNRCTSYLRRLPLDPSTPLRPVTQVMATRRLARARDYVPSVTILDNEEPSVGDHGNASRLSILSGPKVRKYAEKPWDDDTWGQENTGGPASEEDDAFGYAVANG